MLNTYYSSRVIIGLVVTLLFIRFVLNYSNDGEQMTPMMTMIIMVLMVMVKIMNMWMVVISR